jgi:hypothetical protein
LTGYGSHFYFSRVFFSLDFCIIFIPLTLNRETSFLSFCTPFSVESSSTSFLSTKKHCTNFFSKRHKKLSSLMHKKIGKCTDTQRLSTFKKLLIYKQTNMKKRNSFSFFSGFCFSIFLDFVTQFSFAFEY